MGEAGLVNKEDIVLEIGPGKGALTEKLLSRAKKVIAIEKDRDLIEILKEKFKEEIMSKKLELIEADILEVDPKDLKLKNNEYKIIANIPYNINLE
jgi:16S rRNA (adenine1518-N6/adenine1519-N6)-dimethyltransferase